MQPADRDGAQYRWLNKPVLSSRLLDEMEDLSGWSFKGEGEMSLSSEHVKEGRHSLKIQSTLNMGRVDGSGDWTDLVATRKFPSEDWSGFNRISLWIYPDIDGAPAISASLVLHNEGAHILPDSANEGRDDSIPSEQPPMEPRGLGDRATGPRQGHGSGYRLRNAQDVPRSRRQDGALYRPPHPGDCCTGSCGGLGCNARSHCLQPFRLYDRIVQERHRERP